MDQIEYLESERKKIWENLVELRDLIVKKTPDYEQEARQFSKKSSEYKNKCEAAKDEARAFVAEIQKISNEVAQANVSGLIADIKNVHENFIPKTQALTQKLQELEALFASYATYADKLKKLDELNESADEASNKIETTVKQLAARKNEIDKIYFEIFGYSTTDEKTGAITTMTGKKEELDNSFVELKNGFEKFSREKADEFNETVEGWNSQFLAIHEKIESLLPNALTAGLSAAYSKKKNDELADYARLEGQFENSIKGLVIVSLFPFIVSIAFLVGGKTLAETIYEMPRAVLSILPLYIPVLWLAYSFNRKMNLSKRLIEEYTHKEVLSKTFEGLSTQIQNIKDSDVSADLKARLLYNILEVSSENPGKLISNYDKSDHPLMDALDKSVKLHNSIDYLSKIPGMGKLVDVLNKRADELLDKTTTKAAAGIDKVASKAVE